MASDPCEVGTSSFAKFEVSKMLSDRIVIARMQGAPRDNKDVERFCGDFLAVLCSSANLSVSAPDDEVTHVGRVLKTGKGRVGMVMYVNMDLKAVPYAEDIIRWIESEYTQTRVRNLLAGTAIVVRSKVMRRLTNHILSRAKPGAPRSAFGNETEAVEWLRSLA